MATPFESAQLIMQLYELRREDKMREARNFWFAFNPKTMDEYMAVVSGPNSAHVRMVTSYWEMAASFVTSGAIDAKMFEAANGEHLVVFGKVQHLLPQLREAMGSPQILANLEKVVMATPDAQKRIDMINARIQQMLAARAQTANA